MAEGKLDILSSKSSDQSWTPSKTETKRTDSKNSRSFADRLLICERSDAFRLIPRIQDGNGARKLFIGGISWDTNEDRLREYFQTFGEVVEAVIMKDRNTYAFRGFGFVVFADPSVAERVVREKHIIDGRTNTGLRVFLPSRCLFSKTSEIIKKLGMSNP
ncbi:Heterogeneous nuclear ribonucleoprotein 1 [Camellia lanceoleosa]|uniref:Heterogeneous nuclear ribonucleoprotein 1 n=1 Tax=Camellia lanceoleosa TaxID=1840588 RepID=A0ACC0GUD9_9ERIC|nr:Heterogeneous nuclear ribonucleoprotein 1 [Camellia lanceoleosa]